MGSAGEMVHDILIQNLDDEKSNFLKSVHVSPNVFIFINTVLAFFVGAFVWGALGQALGNPGFSGMSDSFKLMSLVVVPALVLMTPSLFGVFIVAVAYYFGAFGLESLVVEEFYNKSSIVGLFVFFIHASVLSTGWVIAKLLYIRFSKRVLSLKEFSHWKKTVVVLSIFSFSVSVAFFWTDVLMRPLSMSSPLFGAGGLAAGMGEWAFFVYIAVASALPFLVMSNAGLVALITFLLIGQYSSERFIGSIDGYSLDKIIQPVNTSLERAPETIDGHVYSYRRFDKYVMNIMSNGKPDTIYVFPENIAGFWRPTLELMVKSATPILKEKRITIIWGADKRLKGKYFLGGVFGMGELGQGLLYTAVNPIPTFLLPFDSASYFPGLGDVKKVHVNRKDGGKEKLSFGICYEIYPFFRISEIFSEGIPVLMSNLVPVRGTNGKEMQRLSLEAMSRIYGKKYFWSYNE